MVKIKQHSQLMRWTLAMLVSLLVLFAGNQLVSADQTVNKMDISLGLKPNGTANITEKWNVTADEGSEIYKTLQLKGPQQLSNYSVALDGKPMKRSSYWNPHASKRTKNWHYGQNGHELNWGITKYGTHTYTIKYSIANFVEQTKTKQMIAWTFLEKDVEISPRDMTIKIHDPQHKFSAKNGYGIWGFGFNGATQFNQGQVKVANHKSLTEDNYVKILMEIPRGTYQTNYQTSRSFDSIVKEAFKGSDFNYQDYKSGQNIKNDRLHRILWVSLSLLGVIGVLIIAWFTRGIKNYHRYYPSMKKLQKQNQGKYYRSVTAHNVFELYYLFTLIPGNGGRPVQNNNFLTAALLQLVKDGHLRQESVKGKHQPQTQFVLLNEPTQDAPLPLRSLYSVLKKVENEQIVTQKALSKYLSDSENWQELMADFSDYSHDYCLANGLIESSSDALKTSDKKKKKGIRWARMFLNDDYQLTDQGRQIRTQLAQLKNYLEEFSLLNERNIQEVTLWDEYMLLAAAFGILDKVEKQLQQVYPNYDNESIYYTATMHPFTQTVSFTHSVSYSSAGGGGATSSGGGGSVGGSSGGGGFR